MEEKIKDRDAICWGEHDVVFDVGTVAILMVCCRLACQAR